MFKIPLVFLLGVFVGQEYKQMFNVKNESVKMYNLFIQSEFYNELTKKSSD